MELAPRAQPTQKRAKELVEKILDTTAELLDEVGVDALTTNLIAQRAGIRIASVYRYFPNKFAVMAAVWDRVLTRELAKLTEFMETSINALPLEAVVDELVETAVAVERGTPGILTLLRAMRVTPELREVELRSGDLIAVSISGWLKGRGARIPEDRLLLVSRTVVEAVLAILEFASDVDPREEAVVIEELKRLVHSYFANYFDT